MKRILLVRSNIEIVWENAHPVNFRPAYTLKYIEALLNKDEGFDVRLIDAYARSMPLDELLEMSLLFDPDILVISSTFLDSEISKEYIEKVKIRRPGVIVIATGSGPSSLSALYEKNKLIDFTLRGEPELQVCWIIKRIQQGEKVSDISRQLNTNEFCIVHDLDALPFLDYNKKEASRYVMNYPLSINKRLYWGHILSSRGCPYNCIFCSPLMRDSYGKKLRLRKTEDVVGEMQHQVSCGVNVIAFDDDNFTTSKEHVLKICHEIIKRKVSVPWIVHARVDNLDRELMTEMKKAGCCLLRIGVESGSQRVVDALKKTDEINWCEKAEKVFGLARELRIGTAALFIVGSPLESKEDVYKSIELARRMRPDILQLCFFSAFPGSPIYKEVRHEFNTKDFKKMYHYGGTNIVNLSNMQDQVVVELYKTFYRSFLFDPSFIFSHICKYFWFYIFNDSVFFRLLNIRRYLIKTPWS